MNKKWLSFFNVTRKNVRNLSKSLWLKLATKKVIFPGKGEVRKTQKWHWRKLSKVWEQFKNSNRYKLHQKKPSLNVELVYCKNSIQKIMNSHFSPRVKLLNIAFSQAPIQDRHSTTTHDLEETTVSVFTVHSSIYLQSTGDCVTCRNERLNKAWSLHLAV